MAHFGKIIGISAVLAITAGAGGILAAVNTEAQEGAAKIHANAVELNTAYDDFVTDTQFAGIADHITLMGSAEYMSTADHITSGFVGASVLNPVYALLPGTKALVAAAEEEDLISKKYADENVRGKMQAQTEAKHLCSLLENSTVSVILSSEENKDFLNSGTVPDNLSQYMEYCDATGTKFEAASSTTPE